MMHADRHHMRSRLIFFFESRNVRAFVFLILILVTGVARGQDSTKISLLFIGDIMQHDTQIAAAYDPISEAYNYTQCFENVKTVFETADITIGNLELSLGGPPYKGYPNFSAPDEIVGALIESGVDVLVTANNHCLDRGKKGLQRTIAVLDTFRIPHTGTFVDSAHRANTYPLLIEKNGFKISLLNYTYGTNGIPVTKPNIVNYIDTTLIAADLIKAKEQQPDVIITFFHWGDEYQRLPNKSQKDVAEFCFKNGVKLVIGSHPHVLQPMEWRKEEDQLVVYSLGNFVSGQSSRYKNGGGMLYVELEKNDSTTNIATAAYELQYVYRDAMKRYHIIPVEQFESDTTLIQEKAARASIREFASDSRKLFQDHNLNIEERVMEDSVYFIVVEDVDTTLSAVKFYGIRQDSILGEFYDKEVAKQALIDITTQQPDAKAVLKRRRKD
jgi:poly-gamma-glutamate capsule biosynthesis protein CapA/YwtB (metallophosphatase superfamily)